MKEHELRVVKEKEELDEKRKKLKPFLSTEIYEKMDGKNKLLLVKQLNIMDQYSDILQERIRLFEDYDLGELDASKACQLEGGACESCQ